MRALGRPWASTVARQAAFGSTPPLAAASANHSRYRAIGSITSAAYSTPPERAKGTSRDQWSSLVPCADCVLKRLLLLDAELCELLRQKVSGVGRVALRFNV